MNVTLNLPDELCKAARHRAVDESKSLSALVTELLYRELEPKTNKAGKTLAELLGDPATASKNFELPDRHQDMERKIDFR